VAFIDPIFEGPTNVENDEHPSSNVQVVSSSRPT